SVTACDDSVGYCASTMPTRGVVSCTTYCVLAVKPEGLRAVPSTVTVMVPPALGTCPSVTEVTLLTLANVSVCVAPPASVDVATTVPLRANGKTRYVVCRTVKSVPADRG